LKLQQVWLRRGALAWLLRPVSAIFGLLAATRRLLYRIGWLSRDSVPVPVIVVGNVVAGGAGKTPVVMAVVAHLRARGFDVGIVSRGYGRRTVDCREVAPTSDARDVGDEPALLRRSTGAPVFVARRRIEAARALLDRHPGVNVIVSDDGLQHLALVRDVEICVFDERGVRPCDLVIHTGDRPGLDARSVPIPGFRAERALGEHGRDASGRLFPLAALRGTPLTAVAAIARPERFFDMLRAQGLRPSHCIALPDHHDFEGWTPAVSEPGQIAPTLLCTEKDAVKLWRTRPDALAVPLVFTPEPAFFEALDAKLSSLDGYQAA
jgi:tetraacyldisaccharide 4'-kinase